jgi:hypothetical protein
MIFERGRGLQRAIADGLGPATRRVGTIWPNHCLMFATKRIMTQFSAVNNTVDCKYSIWTLGK